MLCRKMEFKKFIDVWNEQTGYNTPKHHQKICEFLEQGYASKMKRCLLLAFRNSGKSTVVGLFCAWLLAKNSNLRILVLAADFALAKKMVRNVKRIIEQHPACQHLKPAKKTEWAADYFTVERSVVLRDPSMLAKGIDANITGLRADVIICDDVEVPKNCRTAALRETLKEKLLEIDFIITPSGFVLYIGTPHVKETIYKT